MLLAAVDFDNLHQVLRVLYDEMMPLCGNMTGVAKGIAGLGALFYVAAKVWQSLARAEPIDVYPLLRPFALGLCIMFSHVRAGDYQHGIVASGERVQPAYGNADFRHERVPGAERPTGI